MQDYIKITNLKIFAHHGVFPEETRDGQDFYVNAKLYLDCRKAGLTDLLEDSMNYGEGMSVYDGIFAGTHIQADRECRREARGGELSLPCQF